MLLVTGNRKCHPPRLGGLFTQAEPLPLSAAPFYATIRRPAAENVEAGATGALCLPIGFI